MFEENKTILSFPEAQCYILIENDLSSHYQTVNKNTTTAMRGKCNYSFSKFDQKVNPCTTKIAVPMLWPVSKCDMIKCLNICLNARWSE